MTQDAKIDKIFEHVSDMRIELAKHTVYHENYVKNKIETDVKLIEHANEIKVLTAHKNTIIGKQTVLASIFGSVFGAIGAWLIKHS